MSFSERNLRIKKLELEKEELLEFVKDIPEYDYENILAERKRILKKYNIELEK